MTCKQTQLLEIAENHLNQIISTNFHDLDLPCAINFLKKSEWCFSYEEKTKLYSVPVYMLTTSFSLGDSIVATYTIYIGNNLNFIDEFFTTYK